MNNKIYPFLQKFIVLFILIGHLGNGRLSASNDSLFSYVHSCASTDLFTGAIELFIRAPLSIFDNLIQLIFPLFSSPMGYKSITPTLLQVSPCLTEITPIHIINLLIATFAWTIIEIKFKIFDHLLNIIGGALVTFLMLIALAAVLIAFLAAYLVGILF